MKNAKLELLFIVLLLTAAVWTQLHAYGLPVLMGLGLIPLFGSVIATNPPKRAHVNRASMKHLKRNEV